MESLASYIISQRIDALHREAQANRLAHAGESERTRSSASERTRAGWRRQVGGGARRLSQRLADVAAQLDPAPSRRSYGRE